jgi:uncharacterized RDD family membrane protein YckC
MTDESSSNSEIIDKKSLVGTFKRGVASAIDSVIVLFARIFFIETIGRAWAEPSLIKFSQEFKDKFGTETPKNTPDHLDFIYNHEVFTKFMILFFLTIMIGAFYHAYLNSSSWRATIGKRTLGIIIVKKNLLPLSFSRAILHYFLSVLPFVYVFYLVSYQIKFNLTIHQAITASPGNIFFGILFMLWVQIQVFSKNKTTAYDLICNTIFIHQITEAKKPWSKINNH